MIQPQQLRVLVAIRDAGSLTRAAQALGYGVPTIAHHLASLERHFKARLVVRDPRGARLTPLGIVFVTEAEEILARLELAERLVTTQRDLGLATVRIGTFASVGSQLLPRAIRQLRSLMPVQVEVVEAEPTDVVEQLHAGDLHGGLIYDSAEEPGFTSPDLTFTVLLEEHYRVLVASESSYASRAEIDLADLVDADWISSRDENEASDRVLRRACHLAGFEPKIVMRTDDLNMIHGLVAEGLGCTLATQAAVDTRFPVVTRPTTQGLGIRRTSFVHRSGAVPRAVEELHGILVGLLARTAT
ncbi:LysR family transcriptional regulator [Nocardioides sp.]|uniref:LysR family transcriptional regulator n=1 Tax=Nocardioides sp. TaxID=35761 RepID=UPI002B8D3264|nr:LysR family transcriptional regulator [Nocardioides sp.]HXH80679.1 LysR family transcriptional regulator [Nocardioides sp.]